MSTLQNAEENDLSALENADELEIEIEDDTPEEDKGRAPMPKEIVEKLEVDELDEISKEKAKQLKKVWHDERRAKEAAARERDEAVRIAQRLAYENQTLKKTLGEGEQVYIGTAKRSYEKELELAKREFKEAYDSGDAERVADAQEKLMSAKLNLRGAETYTPQYNYQEPLQTPDFSAHNIDTGKWSAQAESQQTPQPDPKALSWQERNKWFGEDRVMTSFAFGLHEELVGSGIDPTSDDYYANIDKEIRRRFPEKFDAEKRKRPNTVVASARRTTGPKKVTLTASQVSLAKRLNLTPEQYARELLKLEMGDRNV
jgi:hypothetical protein